MLKTGMRIQIQAYGMLKQWLGAERLAIEVPPGTDVAALLPLMADRIPAAALRSIAVSVNQEFARSGQVLNEGDEV